MYLVGLQLIHPSHLFMYFSAQEPLMGERCWFTRSGEYSHGSTEPSVVKSRDFPSLALSVYQSTSLILPRVRPPGSSFQVFSRRRWYRIFSDQ